MRYTAILAITLFVSACAAKKAGLNPKKETLILSKASPSDPVKLKIGKTYFIEVENLGNSSLNTKLVTEIVNPKKTITVEFKYNKSFGTYLMVKNPFQKKLKYRAFIYYPHLEDWKETSIIPVWPGISSREMWNEKFSELMLSEFELINKD